MAPLLSLPTAVKELWYKYGPAYMLPILVLYGSALAAAALVSKRLIPKVGPPVRPSVRPSVDPLPAGFLSSPLLSSPPSFDPPDATHSTTYHI